MDIYICKQRGTQRIFRVLNKKTRGFMITQEQLKMMLVFIEINMYLVTMLTVEIHVLYKII